ncbi:MAG: thiamine pyrophosphate-dependent enzyme [Acidobacteriota bacterium]
MSATTILREGRSGHGNRVGREERASLLLGDEAVGLGARDAGITAAYAYPGTPATEILEYLLAQGPGERSSVVSWCANEKTAYEQALGVSMAGRRALVVMKHVGLNVAADPFINSAIVSPVGGLVVAVADDPSMHSSQNEQDSRFYADFARIPCLEPATPQEAYDMTREAFELSERFRVPVMVRLVTRLAHQRAAVMPAQRRPDNPLRLSEDRTEWVLLPAFARRLWRRLLEQGPEHERWSEDSPHNRLTEASGARLGVLTTGIAREYFLEVAPALQEPVSHLHVATYPMPVEKIRRLVDGVESVLVVEEGYPFVERAMRGVLRSEHDIRGRMSGHLPPDGELGQEVLRGALGLTARERIDAPEGDLPPRPPRLCDGCPHTDAYVALKRALEGHDRPVITADIGCYTLGALPPWEAGDSCVCMGASVGMAKGAAEAGAHPVVAVIGDSTFLHSGVTPLMDAVAADADMTLLILDNEVVAMTGGQPTVMPSERLRQLVLGVGVDPEHCHVMEAHPRRIDELSEIMRGAIAHRGLSVIIAHRECIEAARKRKSEARRKQS